jgi:hypothetical protein
MSSQGSLTAPRELPLPPEVQQQRLHAELGGSALARTTEWTLSRQIPAAAGVALLALLFSAFALHIAPAILAGSAADLLWSDRLASVAILIAYGFALARAVASGLLRGMPKTVAFLALCALAFGAVVVMQLLDVAPFAASTSALTLSKQAMIVPFALLLFRLFDPARSKNEAPLV